MILLYLIQKNSYLDCHWRLQKSFLDILVSLTAIMSKVLFVHFNKYTRSSKFLFHEHALIWKKDRSRPIFCSWGGIIKLIKWKCQVRRWF